MVFLCFLLVFSSIFKRTTPWRVPHDFLCFFLSRIHMLSSCVSFSNRDKGGPYFLAQCLGAVLPLRNSHLLAIQIWQSCLP